MDNKIALFQGKEVRKLFHNKEWWFVVEDVIAVLTNSSNPKGYIRDMRRRDETLSKGWEQISYTLEINTKGGLQKISCANTEGILRLIQSISSPNAEPFKLWLAKVGYERIQEIEDPELSTVRTRDVYKAKGYPDEWIEKRIQGIVVRDMLTSEWSNRNVKKGKEFAILSNEISRATFGMNTNEYKEYKHLKRENLRDHMNSLELIFSMLGEASTIAISRAKDAIGFNDNKKTAREGGNIAGKALKNLERRTGKKVSTKENYLLKLKKHDS